MNWVFYTSWHWLEDGSTGLLQPFWKISFSPLARLGLVLNRAKGCFCSADCLFPHYSVKTGQWITCVYQRRMNGRCLKDQLTIALKALDLTLGSLSFVKLPRMPCNICVGWEWPGVDPSTWSGDPRQPIISKHLQRTRWLESLRFWKCFNMMLNCYTALNVSYAVALECWIPEQHKQIYINAGL